MKTFFALALLVASISAASLEQRPQYDVEQIRKELNYALSISEHHNPLLENVDAEGLSLKFLCKPCTTLLAFIKKELASMTKIESDVLKPVVHRFCREKLGVIEKVEQVCERLGDLAIDKLAQWITEEGNKIDPQRSCVVLHFC